MESLARLKPAFRTDGTVTAGNASPLNDGAAALLLADDDGLARLGGPAPLARIVSPRRRRRSTRRSSASARSRPPNRALARAGIGWADLDVVELNEAFAVAVAGLPGGPGPTSTPRSSTSTAAPSRSATRSAARGARIVGALAHELHRRGGGWGLAAICIGVGQGLAVVLRA